MKSFFKSITLPVLMLATMPFLVACSDSKEFGDSLFPTEEEDYESIKAYIYANDAVQQSDGTEVVQTPVGYDMPDYSVEFYVNLTRAAEEDITVTVAPDAEKTAENLGDFKAIPADAFVMERGTVTIPKGSQRSSEPIVAKLQDNDAAKSLSAGDTGKLTFAIKEVKGDAKISTNLNSISAYVSYSYNALKSVGSIEDKTKLNIAKILNMGYKRDDTAKLTDGSMANSTYSYVGYGGWSVTLDEETEVSAVAVYPRTGYYLNYSPKSYELFSSNDGENWTSIGTVQWQTTPDGTKPLIAELYSPVRTKYLRVDPIMSFYSSYPYVHVSEIEAYK